MTPFIFQRPMPNVDGDAKPSCDKICHAAYFPCWLVFFTKKQKQNL